MDSPVGEGEASMERELEYRVFLCDLLFHFFVALCSSSSQSFVSTVIIQPGRCLDS
jgi:hypothetical protein